MAWQPSTGAWLFHSITRDFDFWPTLDSISITREEPTAVANFDCLIKLTGVNAGLIFVVQDEIEVTYRGTRVFVGHINAVDEHYVAESGPTQVQITAQDYTAKLDDAIIRRRRKRKKERLRRRVRWILSQLRPSIWDLDGTNLSGLPDSNPFIEAYDYFGNSVREAMEHVADEQRLVFFINMNNRFEMYREDTDPAPFELNNDDPDLVDSFPFSEFHDSKDATEQMNAVLVEPEKRKHTVWRKDTASIVAYRRQERFLSDSNLHRKQQARNFGDRALAMQSEPERTVSLTCWEPGLRPGHLVHVQDALWGVNQNLIVQSVVMTASDPHDTDGQSHLRSDITLTDRRRPQRLRRTNRAINKLARRRPGETYDTDHYVLDHFGRVVESPGLDEGDPITATPTWWKLRWGEAPGGFTNDPEEGWIYTGDKPEFGPTLVTSTPIRWVEGIAGNYNTPFTISPCGPGPGAFSGWIEQEQWVDLALVPTHPSDMAGVYVDVQTDVYQGVASTVKVMVLPSAPIYGRQGAVVAVVPSSTTTTVFIPAGFVPAAGERLWVGVGIGWDPEYESIGYFCGAYFAPPVLTGEHQSGRLNLSNIANPRWAVTSDDIPDLGETNVPAKAPWDEPWTWRLLGTEGAPTYGMDGNAWFVEGEGGVAIGLLGEREEDDQPYGVWSDVAYGIEIEFSIDTLGDTANIELTAIGEGEKATGTLDLEADTITVNGPTSTSSGTFAFAAGERYMASFDTRANKVRGKVWQGPEPAAWNVECAMDETEDDQDRIVMWIRVGAGQRVRVHKVRIADGGGDGRRVVREWIGYASGTEKLFKTRHPFREGSLYAKINGVNLPARSEDGDAAEFTMGFYPSAKAPVRATYIIDQGTGD